LAVASRAAGLYPLECRPASLYLSFMIDTPASTRSTTMQACACGQRLTSKAKYCPGCGEPRTKAAARQQTPRKPAREPVAAEEEVESTAAFLPPLPRKALPGELDARGAGEDPRSSEEPEPVVEAPESPDDKSSSQAARRGMKRHARRAEAQAALAVITSEIATTRRKTLSTLTGISSTAVLGLATFGLIGKDWRILVMAAVLLVLTFCLLCWRRERALTLSEYLSLPHSRSRTGRLRCVDCGALGPGLAEIEALPVGRYHCAKCREQLFAN
jgi:hypothetical protein